MVVAQARQIQINNKGNGTGQLLLNLGKKAVRKNGEKKISNKLLYEAPKLEKQKIIDFERKYTELKSKYKDGLLELYTDTNLPKNDPSFASIIKSKMLSALFKKEKVAESLSKINTDRLKSIQTELKKFISSTKGSKLNDNQHIQRFLLEGMSSRCVFLKNHLEEISKLLTNYVDLAISLNRNKYDPDMSKEINEEMNETRIRLRKLQDVVLEKHAELRAMTTIYEERYK